MNSHATMGIFKETQFGEPFTIEVRQCGSTYQVLDGGLLLATFHDISAAIRHALLAKRRLIGSYSQKAVR